MDLVKAFWILAFIALGIYALHLILTGQWPDYRKSEWERKFDEDYKKKKELEKDLDEDRNNGPDDLPF